MIKPYIARMAGFVIGWCIAMAGAPIVCLADDPAQVVETEAPQVETVRQPEGHWVPLGEYRLTL